MKPLRCLSLIFIFVLAVTACSPADEAPTLTSSTKTAAPSIIMSSVTDTPIPATETPTAEATLTSTPNEATRTPTPTEVPPTSTPEPFLPLNLTELNAGNVSLLHVVGNLPVKEIYVLAFSPSGKYLATLSEPPEDRFNDYMEVWDLSTGEQILLVEKWDSPGGLFFPSAETTLYADNRLYDLASGEVLTTLDVAPGSFSPDGKMYAISDYKGIPDESTIQIIDVETSKEVLKFTHPGMVMHLDFSPDGLRLTGGIQVVNNFVVKVWDISSGKVIADLVNYYTGLTFSPDGRLAAAVKEGQIYLFSADKMSYRASYLFMNPYSIPDTMDFSRAGDMLAIEDKYNIHFVVPETGEELLVLPDECMVKFSPNGLYLVTWCYQSDLKFWGINAASSD